jgi:site-specific recombinase XerD
MNYTTCQHLEHLWLHIEGAYAPNTIRAYKADMGEFILYCAKNSTCALPAAPVDNAKFLLTTMSSGIKSATIRRKVASISAVHRLSNFDDPTKHTEVKLCVRKINRQLGSRFDQAYPVTRAVMDKLLAFCCDDLRGLRNKALLLLAYDSMRRRAELVSLRIEDIQMSDKGTCSILLRRSKTDQTSSGHWIHLSKETTILLNTWLQAADISAGFILRGIGLDPVTQYRRYI